MLKHLVHSLPSTSLLPYMGMYLVNLLYFTLFQQKLRVIYGMHVHFR